MEHIQTITKVDFEVNYYKENVHKSVNNDKKNVIKVVKNIEKENFNTISIEYQKPFELDTVFLGPIIKLLYIELPIFDAAWRVFIGINGYIEELGFPVKIAFPLNKYITIEITKKKFSTDSKKIKTTSFEIPKKYKSEESKGFMKMMSNGNMRTNYISFLFENIQNMGKSKRKV